MTVPLCPLIFTGPEATNCACAPVASIVNNKMPDALERSLDNLELFIWSFSPPPCTLQLPLTE
jgi:hypothetical protein